MHSNLYRAWAHASVKKVTFSLQKGECLHLWGNMCLVDTYISVYGIFTMCVYTYIYMGVYQYMVYSQHVLIHIYGCVSVYGIFTTCVYTYIWVLCPVQLNIQKIKYRFCRQKLRHHNKMPLPCMVQGSQYVTILFAFFPVLIQQRKGNKQS
jgi:hypothetical protein